MRRLHYPNGKVREPMISAASNVRDVPSPRRPAECPVEDWLAFLGHRWNALVLWHLSTGSKRFSELTSLLPGITPKVMTERLDALVDRGLVARTQLSQFPRGSIYDLTNRGTRIVAILDQIETWAHD
jgi:DNA-binding HxlR family transcriptional regulator